MLLLILLILAIVFIVFSTTRLKLHPFLALLFTALAFGLAAGMPYSDLMVAVKEGFGQTIGSIGPVIILGVIIGAFLEHSGGVYGLAQAILKIIGPKRVASAMALIG